MGSKRETDREKERVFHLPSCVSLDYGPLIMLSGHLQSREGKALASREVRLCKGEKGARVMMLRKTSAYYGTNEVDAKTSVGWSR